ncbi:MAG: sensor histidine kinase [Candidatus Marinarcus sp.]|uniref:sensor histidine kinase n=1 Tax=Candidatus Marinarcus sp. TaxID=3100987 RepID=UPI003B00687E
MKENNSLIKKQSKILHAGEVMQNIMHQWKQPLFAIYTLSSGTLLNCEMGLAHKEMYKETLETINDNVKHLITTMNYFNDFLNHKNDKKLFNLKECIQNTVNLIQPLLSSNNIVLKISHCKSTEIHGIEIELMQVFLNIINNAIYIFTQNRLLIEKYIFITTKINHKKIEISIKDNAGGINLSNPNIIFEPYFSSKTADIGTGIGLSMSKKIIEEHLHGKLEVKNEEYIINKQRFCGANFIITLNK